MNPEVPSRLRWACRRGMLELDVLLGCYLEEVYVSLSETDKTLFIRLLECNDQELFDWLTGKKQPQDKEIERMVGNIRHHAKTRH